MGRFRSVRNEFEEKFVRASQNEINEVSNTFCKTNKITGFEKRINRLEKKNGHWLKKFSLFLKDNDHLMAHKITMGLLVPIYMAIIPFVCYGDTPVIRREQMLEFVKTPFSKIYLFILATLYFLYILRKVLAKPLYRLADGLNEGRYEYEIKKIEKEIFDCGEVMIPVTGRKPLRAKPAVKETDSQGKSAQKAFPDLPKIEIHEPEIMLEEHNGLYLYRTFWKGKKSRRKAKRNDKGRKIS